jgi:hypothetical protein
MKRLISIIIALLSVLTLAACNGEKTVGTIQPTTSFKSSVTSDLSSVSSTANSEATTAKTSETTPSTKQTVDWEIPVYKNGSVKLGNTAAMSMEAGHPITHRFVWYQLPGELISLVGDEFYSTWESYYKSIMKPGVEPEQMICVLFVQKYSISKADFENAIGSTNLNNVDEQDELPNANIIYTFDDEVINEYYRRQ